MALNPPPTQIKEFNHPWRTWLYLLWEELQVSSSDVTATVGGSLDIGASDGVYYIIDLSGFALNERFTINLPSVDSEDKRLLYFKAVDISGTANSGAELALQPSAADSDSIEDFPSGLGKIVASNGPLVMNPGDAITILANKKDSTWWVV